MSKVSKMELECRKIVQNDLQRSHPIYIDEEVFTAVFDRPEEIINDTSLSGFLLRYNLQCNFDEYRELFNPQASRGSKLCSLRYMGGSYGYHLIYMALKLDRGKHSAHVEALEMKARELNRSIPHELLLQKDSDYKTPVQAISIDEAPMGVDQSAAHSKGSKDVITAHTSDPSNLPIQHIHSPIHSPTPDKYKQSSPGSIYNYDHHPNNCSCEPCKFYSKRSLSLPLDTVDENEDQSLLSMSVDSGTKYIARNQHEAQHQILNEHMAIKKMQPSHLPTPVNINYDVEPIQRQTDSAKNMKQFVSGQVISEQHTDGETTEVSEQHTDNEMIEVPSVNTVAWSNPSIVID